MDKTSTSKAFNIKSPNVSSETKPKFFVNKKPNKKLRLILISLFLLAIIIAAFYIYQQQISYKIKAIVVCGQTLPYPVCVVQKQLPANCCKKKSPVCYECRHGNGQIQMYGCCAQPTPTTPPPPPPPPPTSTPPPPPTYPPPPPLPSVTPFIPTSTPHISIPQPSPTPVIPTSTPHISIPQPSPTPIIPTNTPYPSTTLTPPVLTPTPTTAPTATPIPDCFDRTCDSDADCSGLSDHVCKDVGGGYYRRCVRYPDSNCSSGDKYCWCTAPTTVPTSEVVSQTTVTPMPVTGQWQWSVLVIIISLTAITLGLLL